MDCVENQTPGEDVRSAQGIPPAVKVAADRAKAEARRISEERRVHRRIPGRALSWMNAAHVDDGRQVSIVDVSRGGVLLESNQPLKPGARQALQIAGENRSIVVPLGVLRSRISALEPRGAIYRVACAFSWLLDLSELATAPAPDDAHQAEPLPPEGPATVSPVASEPLMDTVLREAALSPLAVIPGWQEVVARFVDGTILKGYSNDFDVSHPAFSLRTSAENDTDCVSVPLTGLKAVFFARDFEGKLCDRERKTFVGQTLGRRVHLTFSDGEMIIGRTEGYSGGAGFFVTPVDPRASGVRIFVVARAVRQIRFP